MFKKVIVNLKIFFHGLFHGMKGADEVISQTASYGSNGTEINQQQEVQSEIQDFLRGEETQFVKETRDEYYRSFIESKNYHVDVVDFKDDGTSPITGVVRKKTALDFACKIEVFNPEKLGLRVIQDNKFIPKHNNFFPDEVMKFGMDDFDTLINVERDFIPSFKIERYTNKVVVRTINKKKAYVDFYITMYASQFGKVDAILISKLTDLKKTGNKRSDITDLKSINFITNNAFGENDLCEFIFTDISFKSINVFDGNFVLTFEATIDNDGKSVVEKYKTKELDEKLSKHAVRDNIKQNGIDIFTAKRDIDRNDDLNFTTQTFSLNNNEKEDKDEDSN